MKKTKLEKGITLVALIITIVVLLILAVVSIGAVRNSGIIGHATNTSDAWKQGQANETTDLQEYEEKLNEIEKNIFNNDASEWMCVDYSGAYLVIYMGNSKKIKLVNDTIYVSFYEISYDEENETVVYNEKGKDTIELATIDTMVFDNNYSPDLEEIDLNNKLKSDCTVQFIELEKLNSIINLGNVSKFPEDTFNKCLALQRVELSSNDLSVDYAAFRSCENLKEVIFKNVDANGLSLPSKGFGGLSVGCGSDYIIYVKNEEVKEKFEEYGYTKVEVYNDTM